MITKNRARKRARVKNRIAKKIRGTGAVPRLTVYKSLHHLYAQLVDDGQAKVLASASSLAPDLREELKSVKGQKEAAKKVGLSVAKKAVALSIKKVVFDRNGYLYHGVVKSLADGAREGGLEF
jgi:large subunit ribosomal protein L18